MPGNRQRDNSGQRDNKDRDRRRGRPQEDEREQLDERVVHIARTAKVRQGRPALRFPGGRRGRRQPRPGRLSAWARPAKCRMQCARARSARAR